MTAPRLVAIVSLTIGLLAAPLAAEAQATRVYRVALVLTTSPVAEMAGPEPIHPLVRTFLRELRTRGYVEGQNLVLERRSAEGSPDRYPAIMAELAGLNVDVIVTVGDAMARAAKQATNAIPIVMATSADPVATRVVASLARPGGNVTGLTTRVDSNIAAKRLQLLKEAVPRSIRVVVVHQTPRVDPSFSDTYKVMPPAAQALKVTLLPVAVERPAQFAEALVAITRERADALIGWDSPFNFAHRHRFVELAAISRLPAMYPDREYVTAGGLMSYGVSLSDLFRRAVTYVDKILKGAKPADLPVEQPTKFDLVVNLKTAKVLGLTIPPSVLVQADEVIE